MRYVFSRYGNRTDSGRFWVMPRGKDFVSMLENTHKWKKLLELIDVFGVADHVLNRYYTDDELSRAFRVLKDNHIRLSLEVGAVKPWGITGERVFELQKPMWERFLRLGAEIFAISLDEPLVAVREQVKELAHLTEEEKFAYAVEQTAEFIRAVRKAYPRILIGDIEVSPSMAADTVISWIAALEKRLAEMHIRGQDFFRLDVNWVAFPVQNGSWSEVKRIEDYCRSVKLPFGMIFWASDIPGNKEKASDEAAWYHGVLRQAEEYLQCGSPDQYIIESWIDAPPKALPEDENYTFAKTALDFYNLHLRK